MALNDHQCLLPLHISEPVSFPDLDKPTGPIGMES